MDERLYYIKFSLVWSILKFFNLVLVSTKYTAYIFFIKICNKNLIIIHKYLNHNYLILYNSYNNIGSTYGKEVAREAIGTMHRSYKEMDKKQHIRSRIIEGLTTIISITIKSVRVCNSARNLWLSS